MDEKFYNLKDACTLLTRGGLLIYPTETWYALGCLLPARASILKIFAIKTRPLQKPLPVIAADLAQAAQIAQLDAAPQELIRKFWPGPLTIVLPAKKNLASGLINIQHKVALRISSQPEASLLAATCGSGLTATSANISGQAPAACAADLAPEFLSAMNYAGLKWGILASPGNITAPRLSSTLVEPVKAESRWQLRLLRQGAISRQDLMDWEII